MGLCLTGQARNQRKTLPPSPSDGLAGKRAGQPEQRSLRQRSVRQLPAVPLRPGGQSRNASSRKQVMADQQVTEKVPDQGPRIEESPSEREEASLYVKETRPVTASIYPGKEKSLPEPLGSGLLELSKSLKMPVWVVLQDHDEPFAHIDDALIESFQTAKSELPKDEPIALVVNSPGGFGHAAYQVARMLVRKCGRFTAVVPREAMSAATLLVLGGYPIMMAEDAKMGPLDAQVWDHDKEGYRSALNEVLAFEQLSAYALETIRAVLYHLWDTTPSTVDKVIPHALHFTAEMMQPLLSQIEVVRYTERARILRTGEEYARRLLNKNYPNTNDNYSPPSPKSAQRIAARLVESYPEHGFPIDIEEARQIGLNVMQATDEQNRILDGLWASVKGVCAIGQIREVNDSGSPSPSQ